MEKLSDETKKLFNAVTAQVGISTTLNKGFLYPDINLIAPWTDII